MPADLHSNTPINTSINTQQRFLRRLLVAVVCTVAILVLPVYIVDPFQVFHKPWLPNQLLNENQRYQDAGLINSYLMDDARDYDSAAFGTSASVNFTEAQMAKSFGWKHTLRLFLPGGSPAEIRQVIERALATGKPRHVLIEMDLWSMNGGYRPVNNSSFPLYLYDNSRFNDARYLMDPLVIVETVKTLFHVANTRNGTPELLGYWADGDWVPVQHAGLNAADHIQALAGERLSLTPWSDAQIRALRYPALDNEMLPLLHSLCNTDVDVVLFVPPYSTLYFHEKQQDVYTVIYEPRHILEGIDGCRNIRLHGFDTETFTLDLNNYKDHRHYLLHVSNRLLDWMGQRQHVLTLSTIGDYERAWINKLNQRGMYSTFPQPPAL